MKRLAFIIALFLGMTSTFASDELTFHKGHVAKGKVVLNEATYIKFIYEGESAETSCRNGWMCYIDHHRERQ